MLVELGSKGGRLCSQARGGQIHCPLIVRPTSEDVVTGQLVQALRHIDGYWWLADVLNAAVQQRRFRRRVFRRLRIEPWANQPPYPRGLLPWDEGSTQVDVVITWENPPTTVFVECKYGSAITADTANSTDQHDYPGDQLIRNIRVGLHRCGYFDGPGSLFASPPRDFAFVLLTPRGGHPLVESYRDRDTLLRSIPHADRLTGLPWSPFVGQLSYPDIIRVLTRNRRFLARTEARIADDLGTYLGYKLGTMPR